MTASYTPPQRELLARLLTAAGWVRGTFHIPEKHSFLDYLNSQRQTFTLTKVTLPGARIEEFFAVHRSAIDLIIPESREDELQLSPPGNEYERHMVRCLFARGFVEGTLGVLKNTRVSDHLHNHRGFCVVRDCATPDGGTRTEDIVLVNTDRLVGVAESKLPTEDS